MSECKLNHTHEDVQKKYESQIEFLPKEMIPFFDNFFSKQHSQKALNELFHLLKKYDLSSDEVKEERNSQMMLLLNKL